MNGKNTTPKNTTPPMPNTRVFLVRHGATVLTAEDRFAGATDVPLSDEGREQVQRLAERLCGEEIAAVYASPLGRTVETASILARPHRRPVRTVDGLREISHGRWEQLTRQEVERQFPEEAGEWDRDPFNFAPEGGESGLAVTARALPALLNIIRAHLGQQVLVVSHKATIRLLLSSLLGFDPRRYRDNLDQSPAALNIVDFRDPSRSRLTLFNDTSHYAHGGLAIPGIPTARLSRWWSEEAGPAA
jgi:probable phosphoglycerate mutase